MKYRMRIIRRSLGERLDNHDSAAEIEQALRLLKAFHSARDADATIPTGSSHRGPESQDSGARRGLPRAVRPDGLSR
jgi:hypothetical protein